jgi:hypothetical protein
MCRYILLILLALGFNLEVLAASYGPIHVQQIRRNIFSGGTDGQCYHTVDVTAYCHDLLCIFWEKSGSNSTLDSTKALKALNILQRYIDFGTAIMNYKPLPLAGHEFTGTDGKKRSWTIDMANYLCDGYGGASYNGKAWNGLTKPQFMGLYNSVNNSKPTVDQVFFYEMGRSMYDLKLDEILDWQMEDASKWGYWTLGFNGAMTVLAPEALNLEMNYFGTNTAKFRADRLKDINTYINNTRYNFDNAWSVWLLPWAQNQSINDMMSGLLILMSDKFGGRAYLSELFKQLKLQPTTPLKTDRKLRAKNLYNAAKLAARRTGRSQKEIEDFFKKTLRWTFLS